MRLCNELFEIQIDEVGKTEFQMQPIQYRHIIDPQNLAGSDLSKIFLVTVTSQNTCRHIILIGDSHSMVEHCALLENHMLTVLLNNVIIQLDLTDCSLVRAKELDWLGCNFELHKIESDYLIYGEIFISRLNRNLEKLWGFSGKDIFASVTGKQAFELGTNAIRLYDFLGNFYEIDFAGKRIRSQMT